MRALLRASGSLGLGGLLLLLLMVAMGSATVYESGHTTEETQALFYAAPWFHGLLALLALNLGTAVLSRYPFRRHHIPFVVTHAGLLTILLGALVTNRLGVSGQLALSEGQKEARFLVPGESVSFGPAGEAGTSLDLGPRLGNLQSAVEPVPGAELTVDGIRVTVLRYLPRVTWMTRVTDDSPVPHLAVELVLSTDRHAERGWVFAEEPLVLGGRSVTLRRVGDPGAWERLLSAQTGAAADSKGRARIEISGAAFEFPLEVCMEGEVPVGDTGYTLRVLRYLPHAVVGPERTIVSASERPVNPAIEVQVSGPQGSETRLAFARFPDFHGRPGETRLPEMKLALIDSAEPAPASEIELLCGPGGELAVRYAAPADPAVTHRLEAGHSLPTPWPGQTLALGRRFEQARAEAEAVPATTAAGTPRQPALQLRLSSPAASHEFWLPRSAEQSLEVAGRTYRVYYGDRVVPLGFTVALNSFRIGYYPGGERVRSYESNVTLTDPGTGRDHGCVISMNRPGKFAGYTLYQSSYHQDERGLATVLSVARDPGRPIVFLGYVVATAGVALALAQRAAGWRRAPGPLPAVQPQR